MTVSVNGTDVYVESIQQQRVSHDSSSFNTVLNVRSGRPIITDEQFVTVGDSGSDVLDGAQFYIGSVLFGLPTCYKYSLISTEPLPMLGKVGNTNG